MCRNDGVVDLVWCEGAINVVIMFALVLSVGSSVHAGDDGTSGEKWEPCALGPPDVIGITSRCVGIGHMWCFSLGDSLTIPR